MIVPTFNEAGNITPLIRETLEVLYEHFTPLFLEFIVVDDNSPDGTYRIAASLSDAHVRVIRRMDNPGLRKSIETGVCKALGDVVLWMDADFSHPPRYIPQLITAVYDGFDIAVNSRYVASGDDVREGKGTWLQCTLSWILNRFTRLLLGGSFRDYTSGFCAARASVVRELGLRGDYGEYFIDFIYRAMKSGKRIAELPFQNEPRYQGESKTGAGLHDYIRRGVGYLMTVVKLRFGRE